MNILVGIAVAVILVGGSIYNVNHERERRAAAYELGIKRGYSLGLCEALGIVVGEDDAAWSAQSRELMASCAGLSGEAA